MLSSSASTRTSLDAVRNNRAGLTQKRERIFSNILDKKQVKLFHLLQELSRYFLQIHLMIFRKGERANADNK